jgi:hypothetical protein
MVSNSKYACYELGKSRYSITLGDHDVRSLRATNGFASSVSVDGSVLMVHHS